MPRANTTNVHVDTTAPAIVRETLDLVSRITYKPGWTIRALWDGEDSITLRVDATFDDIEGGGTTLGKPARVSLNSQRYVSLQALTDMKVNVHTIILQLINSIEEHEQQEWYRLNGKPFVDPHREDWNQDVADLQAVAESLDRSKLGLALQSAIYKAIAAGDDEAVYLLVRRLCWVVKYHPDWK